MYELCWSNLCNGSCPNALANEYPEYGYEHCDCKECGYYKGCTDCVLYGTDMCTPINEKGEIMEVKNINIKYVKEGMDKIEILSGGDWIDLRIAEDVTLEAGEFKLIPLGVAMTLPKGYEALVIPRSSTFKKYGIIQANSVGLIDETYCGNNDEWHFLHMLLRISVYLRTQEYVSLELLSINRLLALLK